MRKKFLKSTAILALSTGVLLNSLPNISNNATAAVSTKSAASIEQVLSKLTPAERQAIRELKTSDQGGLQLSPEVDLKSEAFVSVIVEFKDKPAKTAVLEAQSEGKYLPFSEAKQKVDAAHETFQNDLKTIFKKEQKEKKEPYTIKRVFKNSFNGVAMTLPANKAEALLQSKVVKTVWSDMQVQVEPPVEKQELNQRANTHTRVTFPGIQKLHEEGYTGKGVKIGILDTGIDYNHPDLHDAYKGGYDFVDNDNDPMETTYDDWKKSGEPETGGTYYTEHGTHVAGIIAGQGKNNTDYAVEGVAPGADIYAYRVLGPYGSGSTSAILAGIDKAVADGMDIISMSLGTSYNNPLYVTSIAVNNAVLAGVTTVVAAGNAGDGMYTLASPGTSPLAITVGANDVSENIKTIKGTIDTVTADMRLLAQNFTDNIPALKGQTLPVVDVNLGGPSDYTGKDVKGKIALVSRGTYGINDKVRYAKQNGAAAILMYNNNSSEGYLPFFLGEGMEFIPAFNLTYADGLALRAKVKAGYTNFTFGEIGQMQTKGNTLASFSSRGPSRVLYDIKPEVTAPGVAVFSTVPSYMKGPDQIGNYQYAYERLSGTSMATPNVTGVAALLLQANPKATPAEVKEKLMNTADPLDGHYSVFEVGAGQVDPYEAVHSQARIEVLDKTEGIYDKQGNIKNIKEETGAISFGSIAPNGKNVQDKRSLVIYNTSKQAKTFDVKVQFQSGLRGSKDAASNGVQILTDKSITVKENSKQNTNVVIDVPKEADLGTYEGYITYTNTDNPKETYQVPFAIHTVEEGIDHIAVTPPAFTTAVEAGYSGLRWSVGLIFQLKSHMKTLDLFLVDPKTNQEIGFLGTLDGTGADENIEYYLRGAMNEGLYYPLTGDPDHPIAYDHEQTEPGLYKIRVVGTNDQGKTFNSDAPVYYSVTQPKLNLNVDSGVYEYNPDQPTITLTGSVYDPDIEKMKAGGMNVSQANNKFVYVLPGRGGTVSVPLDENGNFTTQFKANTAMQPLQVYMYAENMATVRNYSSYKFVYFVKQGTPYGTAIADKQTVNAGDTVTITLAMNNMKNMKQAEYSFLDQTISKGAELVSIKPHPTLEGKLDIKTVSKDLDGTGQFMERKITATLTDEAAQTGVSGKVPMVDITYKVKDDASKDLLSLEDLNVSYTNTDNTTSSTFGIGVPYLVKRNYSFMKSWVYAEAFTLLPSLDEPSTINYVEAGVKVKVTDETGKEYPNTLGSERWMFPYSFSSNLPITDKPFTLEVDIPGHFTVKKTFTVGLKEDGEVKPYSKALYYDYAPAGDVNKDNVIDIQDAIFIQVNWKSNNRKADINFDGVVDEKDMKYVVDNYLMQNPWMLDKAPKPEKKYKGKTLNDVLHEVGM